jgi:hypothetical protein
MLGRAMDSESLESCSPSLSVLSSHDTGWLVAGCSQRACRLSEKAQEGSDTRYDHQRPVEDGFPEGDSPLAGGNVVDPA